MALSQVSRAIISLVGSTPGVSVHSVIEGLKAMGYEGDSATLSQVPNTVKMLEQHGYLLWRDNQVVARTGWYTTAKGDEVNKYGG